MKKVLLGAFVLVVILAAGLFLWARAVFTQDTVRVALANQLSRAIGQPVTIGSIGVTIVPRLTVNLGQVTIGNPARIRVQTLHMGADFRALLSRRIEHGRLELSSARIELPLPSFTVGGSGSTSASSSNASASTSNSPVELTSVDAIVLRGVEIVSGGRVLTGDVEIVPQGKGLALQKVTLVADKATVNVTGSITDLSGPVGDVAIKAGVLNFDQLLAFAHDFATASGMVTSTEPSSPQRARNPKTGPAGVPSMNLAVSLEADRATLGTLTLEKLTSQARITGDTMTLEPISFGVFGGHYNGALVFRLGDIPDFKLDATLAGVDMGAATAFAGTPGILTGRLSGNLHLAGRGMDASSVITSARGTARVDIVNGVVKNLGLVHTIVVATSGRSDGAAIGASAARDEPFTKLGGTLTIANGSANTQDLRFESKDLLLSSAGSVRLDGSGINLAGKAQLSDELSKQAGQDLVRYTQEGGRFTVPVTITGSGSAPQVRVDISGMAKRALTNRANEEVQKVLKKGLGDLFKK
jgi:uncharacterized protein involved in outer membrane biogenesis